jgi:hypothetical protein
MREPKSRGRTLRGLATALEYAYEQLMNGYKSRPVEVPENGGAKMRITPAGLRKLAEAAKIMGMDLETYITYVTDNQLSTGKIVVKKSGGPRDVNPKPQKRRRGQRRGPAADGKESGKSR